MPKVESVMLRYHPVSGLFPLMVGKEFDALVADIAEHGQLEPILIYDGMILDGRNRWRACRQLGIEPITEQWQGDDPRAFVVSLNLHRRHLTSDQRAVIALAILPELEREAQDRMFAGKAADPETKMSQGSQKSADQAAQIFQTSATYVKMAKSLQQKAPDLLQQVADGAKSLRAARWEQTRRERQDAPPLPTGKYRIMYADPPWQYDRSDMDNYGHTQRHYPSMSIDELMAMRPVLDDLLEDDAVLFLWATSPLLPSALRLMQGWGFAYKVSFIWDKVRHNYGHYNSVRHEFLLVGTRGNCTPDVAKLFDSVQAIERTSEHSEKPKEFRAIIDTLYTHGRRLELFARTKIDGWDCWGNEPG